MPYRIQWESPFGVQVQHFGIVTLDEVAELMEVVSGDEGFDDLRYWIADFRETNGHTLDLDSPGKFESAFATLIGAAHGNPHIHCAFVCADAAIEQAIHVVIERKLVPFDSQMFHDEAEARDWLAGVSGTFRKLDLR